MSTTQYEFRWCPTCLEETEHEQRELPIHVVNGKPVTHRWVCCAQREHARILRERVEREENEEEEE